MNGVTTVFDHKKWVFAYVLLGIAVWRYDAAQLAQFLTVFGPSVLAANWMDKSKWRKENNERDTL